jgi:hypothetical protein
VVIGVIAVVLWQMHLSLLLRNTTVTGGDTGAHVMMPQYLWTLLTHGHLTGWSPQWYDGYPIYTFYFVLPDLIAAVAGHIIPYNIAFKLLTILGSLALPVAVWALGRLFGLRRPIPAMLAAASLPFLFDYTFTIYGGNLFSTMAGEYAFSLSLSLALLFLGLFARALRTGRGRGWAAVTLAACILSHIVPAFYALVGAAVLTLFEFLPARVALSDERPFAVEPEPAPARLEWRRALWTAVSTVGIGVLLSGWWLVPFFERQPYANSMNYGNLHDYAALLLPEADDWAIVLAGVAVVLAIALRSRFGLLCTVLAGASALAVVADPQGSGLYNVRFLPLWFISVYLLAGWSFAVLVLAVARWCRHEPLGWRRPVAAPLAPVTPDPEPAPLPPFRTPAFSTISPSPSSQAWFSASGSVPTVPGGRAPTVPSGRAPTVPVGRAPVVPVGMTESEWASSAWAAPSDRPVADGVMADDPRERIRASRRWPAAAISGPLVALAAACLVVVPPFFVPQSLLPVTVGPNMVSVWSTYNYSGYQASAFYPEYQGLMTTMANVGKRYGCGRAMWEYNADQNRFGTPEALMLLPYWTGNCIDSMEGLLFESSSTTPYHFLNQAELSVGPSEPQVGLDYGPVDVPLGVQHLQLLGVRYFMAFSPQVVQAANADPALSLVASSGPWRGNYNGQNLDTTWSIYLVHDSQVVAPLQNLPAVLTNVKPDQNSWLAHAPPSGTGTFIPGPSETWYLNPADFDVELAQDGPANWPRVAAGQPDPPTKPVPTTAVTRIRQSDQSISFHVSRTGTPVLVKISYFPNWHAVGASGPWRVTPNLMVVVPTSHDVTLVYGSTGANTVGLVATLLGAVGVVATVVVGRRRFGTRRRNRTPAG